MSDDIKAAAERLRKDANWWSDAMPGMAKDGGWLISEREYKAAVAIATAYLAEHPADDDEPITEKWLQSVGFTKSGKYGPRSWSIGGMSCWKGNDHGDWQFRFELSCCNRHKSQDTRGDVRRLCSALGIELEDGNGS